jgi:hypothetical protein
MPYLRCHACGAKALPIATRCPSCEAPFEVPGDPASRRRMRPCPQCDSLLAREAEACRWCGAALAGLGLTPVRAGIAAGVCVALVGAWALLGGGGDDVVFFFAPESEVVLAPVTAALPPSTPAPSTPASSALRAANEPEQATLTPEPAEPAASFEVAEEEENGWVRAVARTFVNVRAAPTSDGLVEGVVAENTVVFLGDARGAWRRIRSGSVAGWAWEPLFTVASEGP